MLLKISILLRYAVFKAYIGFVSRHDTTLGMPRCAVAPSRETKNGAPLDERLNALKNWNSRPSSAHL